LILKLDIYGNESLPPLVFLHGFLGSSFEWHYFREKLAANFFCLTIDLPGHGNAPSINAKMDLRSLSQRLKKKLAPVLSSRSYSIVGYSLGARLALRHAIDFPCSIEKLILEGVSPGIDESNLRQKRLEQDMLHSLTIKNQGLKVFLENWYENPIFLSLQQQPQLLETIKQMRAKTNPVMAADLIVQASPGIEASMWPFLSRLTLPVLYVGGIMDKKYIEILAKAAKQTPKGKLSILDNAGHIPHLEVPNLFLQVLKEFLLNPK